MAILQTFYESAGALKAGLDVQYRAGPSRLPQRGPPAD